MGHPTECGLGGHVPGAGHSTPKGHNTRGSGARIAGTNVHPCVTAEIEVITDRSTNVELHRRIQAAALRAAQHCHWLASKLDVAVSSSAPSLSLAPVPDSASQLAEAGSGCRPLVTDGLHWRRYSLPLALPLTTPPMPSGSSNSNSSSGPSLSTGIGVREGLLLQLRLSWTDGSVAGEGVGDVAPLPGLHSETLEEAEVQVCGGAQGPCGRTGRRTRY
ncbi:hypothetical protein Vretimale_14340 [Volvox reticuliferus]|uniref:Uncharacterized protein n=1 Tax=Volvox reticuliferus TaxID=1737510 RepID=A0A8J4D0X3_9CHLO|nr:hypothetical protein Vretifemale_20553 [Volvox reticuliferus]GIM10770.1 hypothetical protein Vretimale_14340 [Volvox reticuliferus]